MSSVLSDFATETSNNLSTLNNVAVFLLFFVLDLAVTESALPSVVEVLLRAYPEGSATEDSGGNTPLAYAMASLSPNTAEVVAILGGGRDRHDPAVVLYNLVARGEWFEAESRLSSDPSEASVWVMDDEDADGRSKTLLETTTAKGRKPRLPIHVACCQRPSLRIVQDLLDAYPTGASSRGGRYDLLPLHVACQNGAGVEVVSALLDAYPEGVRMVDTFGLLPIRELSLLCRV